MRDDLGGNTAYDGAAGEAEASVEVVTFFAGKLREAIENLAPRLTAISEQDLIEEARPTATDWGLRRNLHNLVNASLVSGDPITTTKVYEGIQAKQNFFTQTIPNPVKIAFISRPIVAHTEYYEQIHQIGLKKLIDYIETNEVNDKNVALFMKLVEKAGDRVHGAVAQKMQIQSKNLNVDVSAGQLPSSQGSEDIQLRIKQLQGNLLENGMKDVTPGSSEDPR